MDFFFFFFLLFFCHSYNFGCRYLLLLSAYWYDNVVQGITVSYLFFTSSDFAFFLLHALIMRNMQLLSSYFLFIYILILEKEKNRETCIEP